jgi:alanyl-tRNA synthetase
VLERGPDGRRLYLDRTAFYPASGGQPHDVGWIAGVPVLEVVEEDERIAHLTAGPVEDAEVACRIDWTRRFDHMQQHSGQHVLSAVLVELYGFQTVGFHLGAEVSSIDLATPTLDARQIAATETRANEVVFENRPVAVSFEGAAAELDLRRPSERQGMLRVVSIEGLDRSACGGTHVRATGEIGPILFRRVDRAHGAVRLEFLCGGRAVRRARADFEALARIARVFSSLPGEAAALVEAQNENLQAAERVRRKLAAELAVFKGRELYAATAPDSAGMRRVVRRLPKGALDDELRATAQAFSGQSRAVFLAVIEDPPAVLLAVSKDAGLHAGEALKAALAAVGGRGGGGATLAQGSAPSHDALVRALEELG